jgi:probable HAF family extracellular repeat protein
MVGRLVLGASVVVAAASMVVMTSPSVTASPGFTDIGTLGGSAGFANAVSGGGEIVGQTRGAADPSAGTELNDAVAWTPSGGTVDLGTLGGPQSQALGVNDRGDVVGISSVAGDPSPQGFLWSPDGGMVNIGTLGGANTKEAGTVAAAVNDRRQVVGSSVTAAGAVHAFEWSPYRPMRDLGTLGGTYSRATSINRRVRWSASAPPPTGATTPSPGRRGVAWSTSGRSGGRRPWRSR